MKLKIIFMRMEPRVNNIFIAYNILVLIQLPPSQRKTGKKLLPLSDGPGF